ncbi:unnamed protein product [Scytosiphon promiscuus]
MMKLSRQLRSRKKNKPPAAATAASTGAPGSSSSTGAGAASQDDADDDADEEDYDDGGEGVPTEETAGAGGAPGESGGFPGSIVKSWWRSRYPYEGAAGFGLMREEMLIKSNAQQIWLKMSDGVLLDCCYCRAYGGNRDTGGGGGGGGRGSAVSGSGTPDEDGEDGDDSRSTGCVLFCNPNAGYYESMVLAGEGSRNWVSFYTSVGCDVFLFNYRGYGRSGGKASPESINRDVREVVEYLREQVGVTRLAVHGESIGGVAAASVARNSQVDLLVLDRSFASLSAVAQRLMGGWTKWAIWGFTGWDVHVASDYLACRCYKVLACDPEDMIIAEASSAKAGVSVMVELGDRPSSLDVYQPPKAYKVADHLRTCPPVERVSLPLCPQERLTSTQIAHFAACLRYIARKAPRIGAASSRGSPTSARRRRRRRRPGGGDLTTAEIGSQEVEMVSLGQDGDSPESAGEDGGDPKGPDPLLEGSPSMLDVSRPLGELWVLLSRIDGLCGRMLGRAVAKGFDDVRAWVCCLVVLGPVVRADATGRQAEAAGSLSLESASRRLQTLLKEHPDELGSDPFVTYVSRMLLYLVQRLAEGGTPPPPAVSSARSMFSEGKNGVRSMLGFARGGAGGGRGGGSWRGGRAAVGGASGPDREELGIAALEAGGGVADGDAGYGIEMFRGDANELMGAGRGRVASSSTLSPSTLSGGGDGGGPSLGRILPLHCGHNNSYSDSERRMLLEHLALQGWVAPDRRPLEAMPALQ